MSQLRITLSLAFVAALGVLSIARAEEVRLPSTRDLWVSSARGEEDGANGGAPRLKLKGYQEFSLLDFDLEPLRGKRVVKARISLTLAGDERLYRTAVSTISEDWNEGTGTNYESQPGASSFRRRVNPDVPWLARSEFLDATDEETDLTSVVFGEGGSIWSHADASEPSQGRQTIDLAPEIVASRLYGFSYGFVIFDDQGTELARNGDSVEIRLFPNRFAYSREQNRASQPYLEVEFEEPTLEQAQKSPDAPSALRFDSDGLPRGAARVFWTQTNCVSGGVLGFEARANGRRVPVALVPRPALGASKKDAQETQQFEMRLEGLPTEKKTRLEIVAVDSFGKKSKPSAIELTPSARRYEDWAKIVAKTTDPTSSRDDVATVAPPTFNGAQIAVLNEFVKFAEDGSTIPAIPEREFVKSAIWDAAKRRVELAAARNEFIGFEIALRGKPNVRARLQLRWNDAEDERDLATDWARKTTPTTTFYRFEKVDSPKGRVPDPMIPCRFDDQNSCEEADLFYCEIFVPKNAATGQKLGKLVLADERGKETALDVALNVWNFSIPNELSFLPEMNCYSLPENEREYYRLAQLHRVYVNRVPYSHRGRVGDGLAPEWNPRTRAFDWTNWRKRFAPYFTGEAFADLPRGAVPIEAFYLPLFENFPADVFTGLDENAWPDENAFSEEYRKTFRRGVELFAKEIRSSKWTRTRFLFFLNNKSDYKRDGWSRASSPWLLDEPASARDFAALQYFGRALKEANSAPILFRADISRPQWERDFLADALDVYVVPSDVNRQYRRMIQARCDRCARMLMTYGETAPPHETATQPISWCLDAWTSGADGVVPWQTIGNDESWRKSDPLALFYPPCDASANNVVPSLRLKAFRRGEQDAEYLALLQRATKRPRAEIAAAARKRLLLDDAQALRNDGEDAGKTEYAKDSPEDLELFRREIGEFLNRRAR